MTAGDSSWLVLPAHWTEEQVAEFRAALRAGNRELMVEMLLAAGWRLEAIGTAAPGSYLLPVRLEPPKE